MTRISPCLWFDGNGMEAAELYISVIPGSRITDVSHYGADQPGEEGAVMTVAFELAGQPYTALNGGPMYKFTEAFSLSVDCKNQEEVDRYWTKLTADGGQEGPCGWCKDKFGLSWQIVPTRLPELLQDPDREKSQRVMAAMLEMGKIDVGALERAAAAA
jgi:predicted 3-demethylubiquinone-9 3-methyltransferase (glyoxalase superfamily)